MKSYFKNIDIIEFEDFFSTDEKCLEYLASSKWRQGYTCRKCGHDNFCKGKKPFSRRCTKCKSEESATAHTIFHKCKLPLNEAFKLTYMVCHQPDISSYKLSETMKIRNMTCWNFKKKILECIDNRGDLNLLEKENIRKDLLP